MAQWLVALAAFGVWFPTLTQRLVTVSNSSSWDLMPSFGLHMWCTEYSCRQMLIHEVKLIFEILSPFNLFNSGLCISCENCYWVW